MKKSLKEFKEKPKSEQQEVLGTLMFNRIEESKLANNEDIPKMTGMLIDTEILDLEEIVDILENEKSL